MGTGRRLKPPLRENEQFVNCLNCSFLLHVPTGPTCESRFFTLFHFFYEAEAFIFGGHVYEMAKRGLELFFPMTLSGFDERNPNPFITCRKFMEIVPGLFVSF